MSILEEVDIEEVDNIEDLKDYIIKLEDRIEILEEFKKESMVIFKELNKFMNKL